VARWAGVSHGTVSHVLNHPERVRPETRARVEAAIAELGFVRDEAARHLRAGYSRTIGLMLLDAWNPSFMEIARGVEERTSDGPWTVLMSNSARDTVREQRYLQEYAARRVAGLIVIPNDRVDDPAHLRLQGEVPLVVVDRAEPEDSETMSVAVDDAAGGTAMAQHLAGLGHRRIAFVGDPAAQAPVHTRFDAFRAALRRVEGVELEVVPAPLTIQAGLDIGSELAARPPARRPTAVAAGVDLLAFGVLQSLLSHRIRVPEDISIVGYDDIPFTAQLSVPLTSVARPHWQMGITAAELLLAVLAGEQPARRHVLLPPELIVRASTAAPFDA
jgi:LacI family transcriptional regulator